MNKDFEHLTHDGRGCPYECTEPHLHPGGRRRSLPGEIVVWSITVMISGVCVKVFLDVLGFLG